MNLYVGTSGYSYKEWKGTFYPEKLPAKQMLRFYGERFRTVEINNTFYRMPKASVLEAWAAEVPADFQFVLKAPQQITHIQRLKDAGDSVAYLLEVAGALKERLGPLLFQLPPNFKKDAPRLREFLALLPPRAPRGVRVPPSVVVRRRGLRAAARSSGGAVHRRGGGRPGGSVRGDRGLGLSAAAAARLRRRGAEDVGRSGCGSKTGGTRSCSSSTRTKARGRRWRSGSWSWPSQRRRRESNPLRAGLQPAARPSGLSVLSSSIQKDTDAASRFAPGRRAIFLPRRGSEE